MGTYTDIVEIIAPSGARPGEQVSLVARVKNLYGYAFYIAVTAVFDNIQLPISPEYAYVGAGQIQSFSGSFVMPSSPVAVWVYSWYWTGSEWYLDDERSITIALAEPKAEFSDFAITDYKVQGR